jgi:murein DD-endopeptidase MepM/ murein hydrolase activator NlpD
VGNHWGSGRVKEPVGPCAVAVRVVAATAAVAVSFFAVGLPWTSPHPGGTAAGSVGPGPAGQAGLSSAFLADARALVPFSRTLVRTVAKGGQQELNIASVELKRPPEGSLMSPLEVLNQSSPFGLRVSPITGSAGDFHLGQDYAAACGTRVYAADAGVVRAVGWHPWGGGNRVEIDHGNGLITTYNHLEAIAVHTGDSVQVGQVIARVGTTGSSTGCHLHFETILHGKHTSPLNWTLIPIRQVDELTEITMVSYAVRGAADPAKAPRWAIPVAADHSHTVLGGEDELLEAPNPDGTVPPPATQDASPTGQPSSGASPSPTPTAPTPTGTATGSTTSAPAPTPTGTATGPTTSAPAPTPETSATAAPTAGPWLETPSLIP